MIEHAIEQASQQGTDFYIVLEMTDNSSVKGKVIAYGSDWVKLDELQQKESTMRYHHQASILSLEVVRWSPLTNGKSKCPVCSYGLDANLDKIVCQEKAIPNTPKTQITYATQAQIDAMPESRSDWAWRLNPKPKLKPIPSRQAAMLLKAEFRKYHENRALGKT